MVRWGDVGERFINRLHEVRHAAVIALVYRGNVHGSVRAKRNGMPAAKLFVPDHDASIVYQGMQRAAEALLRAGGQYVHTGIPGVIDEMRSVEETKSLLNPRLKAKHLQMTLNHTFGSCPMGAHPGLGATDEDGKVWGTENVYVSDASLFPSPSAVNPQATIMALSDILSRRGAELAG